MMGIALWIIAALVFGVVPVLSVFFGLIAAVLVIASIVGAIQNAFAADTLPEPQPKPQPKPLGIAEPKRAPSAPAPKQIEPQPQPRLILPQTEINDADKRFRQNIAKALYR